MLDIKELGKSLKQGWVAMDKNSNWWWFRTKPTLSESSGVWFCEYQYVGINFACKLSDFINIKPAESWATSLMEIKNDR